MQSTKAQRISIAWHCNRLGIDKDTKADLVQQYSNRRTASSSELTVDEAKALIQALHAQGQAPAPSPRQQAGERMRRQIIAIFHEAGWHTPQTPTGPAATRPKIDMSRVNEWCVKQGYLHKKLNEYAPDELPKLVTQAKKYLEWYLKKI